MGPRVLLIGIDGATWRVLDPYLDAGDLPTLAALRAGGAWGSVLSTVPAITPPAWATVMTGVSPAAHGILDFLRYDPASGRYSLVSTADLRVPTVWELLSDAGVEVGVLNLPLTYPPLPVRGFMVSGFLTPSLRAPFAFPATLAEEMRRAFPGYRIAAATAAADPQHLLAEAAEEFTVRAAAAKWLCGRFAPQVLCVEFQSLDVLQHRIWDTLTAPPAALRGAVRRCLRRLDEAVGALLALAPDATVIVLSDHGFTRASGRIFVNRLLHQRGWLVPRLARRSLLGRIRRRLGRRRDLTAEFHRAGLPLVWEATHAYLAHGAECGFLYVNVAGRDQHGCVDSGRFEDVRARVADELRRVEEDGVPLFTRVAPGAEVFPGATGPDLALLPREGWQVSPHPLPGPQIRREHGRGVHAAEGIIVLAGSPVQPGPIVDARLHDVAPTILLLAGLSIPSWMEGRPLTRNLRITAPVRYAEGAAAPRRGAPLTPAEEEAVARHLRGLGYLG